MKSRTLRRTLSSLALAAAAMTTCMTGAGPAHADVWAGGEHGYTNVNCDAARHTMQVTVGMTMFTPMPTVDDGSILTPAPAPAYHRFWLYSWTTKSWVWNSKWIYTPGSAATTVTPPSGYYHVYVEYAWALRNNPTTAAGDWLMSHESIMDDYSYFPYLSTSTRGWCLV